MTNAPFDAVIVAAGSGTRLGFEMPKAFVPLAGKPLLQHSVELFCAHPSLVKLMLVVPMALVAETRAMFTHSRVEVTAGGAERWESVRNGVAGTSGEWVLVHDAARPFVSLKVIDTLLEKRTSFSSAFTATPVVDTIRTFSGDTAGSVVDRSKLVRVGTPQLFKRELLWDAFSRIKGINASFTDEAMLMQEIGIPVGIAEGDPNNFKITTKEDLEIAEALLKNRTQG